MHEPDPSVILDLLQAFRWSKTMFAAVDLGVFDTLAEGPLSGEALAKRMKANPDALTRLLDGCVGLQLLDRDDRGYRNTPAASAYLCRNSSQSVTGYVKYSNTFYWKLWANLEDAVREGTNRWKQAFGWDDDDLRECVPHRGCPTRIPARHARLWLDDLSGGGRRF